MYSTFTQNLFKYDLKNRLNMLLNEEYESSHHVMEMKGKIHYTESKPWSCPYLVASFPFNMSSIVKEINE